MPDSKTKHQPPVQALLGSVLPANEPAGRSGRQPVLVRSGPFGIASMVYNGDFHTYTSLRLSF